MAFLSTQPYKGTRDFFPEDMRFREAMFAVMHQTVRRYGFDQIDAPLIEPIDVYLAKTSEEIVGQQIYSFTDRGERKVAIRPEMTPTVARMVWLYGLSSTVKVSSVGAPGSVGPPLTAMSP